MIKTKWTACAISFLTLVCVHAEVRLNSLFTDNMVLQRNRPAPVWGSADPGSAVTVEFAGQLKRTVAGEQGDWQVMLDPLESSSEARLFHVSDHSSRISLANVLVGDVWLCAGQSNMAQTMKRYLIWNQVKAGFSNEQIRMFKIRQGGVGSPEPSSELVIDPSFSDSWQSCTPEYAAEFSATAGFFGMKLQRELDVPVGLLYANRGGTRANMWMPRTVLESKAIYGQFLDASNPEWKPSKNNPDTIRAPSYLYNGTIHPLVPFAIKGCIWYQGESDSRFSDIYTEMMTDLVGSWRKAWGYEFPFLFVQLAPWDNVGWDGEFDEGWAWQREAQLRCLDTVPNSGMVVITDAGEAKDIHPQAKNLPGERLAVLAASLDKDIDTDFPAFNKMEIKDGKVRLYFNGVSGGLETRRVAMNIEPGYLHGTGSDAVVAETDELKGFTICGADRKFVPAKAKIVSEAAVMVWSPEVQIPVAVRYGWANFPLCNLYGGNGMPASPFRTDDFPMPNLTGEKKGQRLVHVDAAWGTAMEPVEVQDGVFRQLNVSGRSALRAEGGYLYFKVPDANRPMPLQVHLIYYDQGYGTIQLRYDSTSEQLFAGKVAGTWKPAGEVRCMNSGEWKCVGFELPDAACTKRCNGGDIRLQSAGILFVGGIYYKTMP